MNKVRLISGMGVLLAVSTLANASLSDVVDCKVATAQGGFESYLPPRVGDTIHLDLANGPAPGQLRFKSSGPSSLTYIPAPEPWLNESGCGRWDWVSGTGIGALTIYAHISSSAYPRVTITETVPAGGTSSEEARLELDCTPSE